MVKIQVNDSSFAAVEKRFAASLRTDSRELVSLPVEEMAGGSGVSQASVVRFCWRLGYSGLCDFRLALAADVRGETNPIEPSIAVDDDFQSIASKVTAAA